MVSSTMESAKINDATISRGIISKATISSATITGSCTVKGTLSGGTIKGAAINGSSITGGTIDGGTITGGSISVEGLIQCGGLSVGTDSYTPHTIGAKLCYSTLDKAEILTTNTSITEIVSSSYSTGEAKGDCSFKLTDSMGGTVTGTISMPSHDHSYKRNRYLMSKTSEWIFGKRFLDGIKFLATNSAAVAADVS